jgi:ectoine hydroxylase-related dioxygenase (phytanoyl-CoA dioxygenase family)
MMSSCSIDADAMTFASDGAQRFAAALDKAGLESIEAAIAGLPAGKAGLRLQGIPALSAILAASGAVGRIAASVLGETCRPVRAVLFDKTSATNWSLAWHQDRTIAVAERREVEGFGPWTVKNGMLHVAPPVEILAGMVTLRAHLDAVPMTNAPLLVAPGSHRLGRISESSVPRVVAACGVAACLAEAGDVWLYATPILHASEAAAKPRRRRVLQVDFATGELPGGPRWLGV